MLKCSKFSIFFNVGSPKESIFLITFYGLYFSHQYINITNYMSSWYRPSVGSFSCTASTLKFDQSSYLFSLKNSCPCRYLSPGLPRNLGTKPICYQLSYPGLDNFQICLKFTGSVVWRGWWIDLFPSSILRSRWWVSTLERIWTCHTTYKVGFVFNNPYPGLKMHWNGQIKGRNWIAKLEPLILAAKQEH